MSMEKISTMTLPRHRSKTSKPTEIEPNASNTALTLVVSLKAVQEQFISLKRICPADVFTQSIRDLKTIMKKTVKISEQKQIELAITSPKSDSAISEYQVESSFQELNRLKVQIQQFQTETKSTIENFFRGIKEVGKKQVPIHYQDLIDRLEKPRSQVFGISSGSDPSNDPVFLFHELIQANFQQVDNLLSLSTNFIIKNETEDFSQDNQKITSLEADVQNLKVQIHDLKKQFDETLLIQDSNDLVQTEIISSKETLDVIKKDLLQYQSQTNESIQVTLNQLEELQESFITTVEEAVYGSSGESNSDVPNISKLKKQLRDAKKRLAIIHEKAPPISETPIGKTVHKIDFPLFIMIILGAFLLGYIIRGRGASL